MTDTPNILRIDSSMRYEGSVSRQLGDKLIAKLGGAVTIRDLAAEQIPFVDEEWIGANFTPEEDRSDAQRAKLAFSDRLVAELKAADILVLNVPMYNFSAPAAFKAWVDMIARARLTFKYTDNGPVGLLEGKKAYVIVTSGGTPLHGEADHLTGYMRKILNFIGINDIEFVEASLLMVDPDKSVEEAAAAINKVAEAA
ncbi:MAG: NAD(P)H-dependent oxidoreductase [Aquisalinus sp.]|nr:NAD(P)H-dependent oxidoreductase [Aquisalinus sp.]